VQTLEGHTNNVTTVLFHPRLPLILSCSEDHQVRVWHASTYKLERTLVYGLERCWTAAASTGSNKVAFGFDEGTVVVKFGHDMPVVSMDRTGKLV
jgi:coatomer subunit beta'